ncbi:MAG: hypothetical protein K2L90_09975, partial [Muribaculaceae bacterium]|nr:hypothetical protein [Muribaculaceae bacterium]
QITVTIHISLGRWQIVATPSLSFDYDRESYHRPYRDLECHGYTYGLAAECRWKVSGTLVRFGGKYAYSDRTSDKHILTSLNCNSSIGKTVESNYMMLSSDRRLTAISAGIDHTINRTMALYTDIRYLLTDYVNANNFSNHLTASIGIRF